MDISFNPVNDSHRISFDNQPVCLNQINSLFYTCRCCRKLCFNNTQSANWSRSSNQHMTQMISDQISHPSFSSIHRSIKVYLYMTWLWGLPGRHGLNRRVCKSLQKKAAPDSRPLKFIELHTIEIFLHQVDSLLQYFLWLHNLVVENLFISFSPQNPQKICYK